MITLVRTARTLPGKFAEAVVWGKEAAAIFKRVTGKELAFCAAFGGTLGELAWIGQFDSVAQFEGLLPKLMADREYATALTTGTMFIAGSGHDQFWRHL